MTPPEPDLVNVSEIARMAGTARSTVSNWKRRHSDFPPERGRNPRGPLFDRSEVAEWLTNRTQDAGTVEVAGADDLDRQLFALAEQMRGVWPVEETRFAALRSLLHHPVPQHLAETASPALLERFEQGVADLAGDTLEDRTAAIDELIELLAASERSANRFLPRHLVRLAAGVLGLRETVLDPSCGAGEFLVEAADHARLLCGQDRSNDLVDLARGRLWNVVIGPESESSVAPGDALAVDLHPLLFDGVISAPPMGRTLSRDEVSEADPRWAYGHPGSSGDAAWIQHAVAHLGPGGRAVMVLAASSISHAGAIGRVRTNLVRAGVLRAVIQLPPRTLAATSHAPVLVVLEHPDAADPTREVLLGDPISAPPPRQIGWGDDIGDSVIAAVTAWLDTGERPEQPGAYTVVDLDRVASEAFNLTPRRYLTPQRAALRSPDEIRTDAGHVVETIDHATQVLASSAESAVNLLPFDTHRSRTTPLSELGAVRRGLANHRLTSSGDFAVHTPATLLGGSAPNRFLSGDAPELHTADPMWNALPGDILVALDGQVGATHLVSEPMFVSSSFAIIRPDAGDDGTDALVHDDGDAAPERPTVSASYLAAWFDTPAFRAECERFLSRGGLRRISIADLASIAVPVPTTELQAAFAELHHRLQAATRAANDLNGSVERLRQLAGEATEVALPHETGP